VPSVQKNLHTIDSRKRLSQVLPQVGLISRHDDQVPRTLSPCGFRESEDFIE